MRGFALLSLVACAVLLPACASDDGGGGGKSFTYTITDSGGTLSIGSSLVLIHSKASACMAGGTYSGFTRTTATTITSATGPVVLKFNLDYSGAYLESGYVDIGNSGHLSNGDIALGPINTGAIYAVCIPSVDSVPGTRTLDWSNDLSPLFGGTVPWNGGTMTY